uniref:26S proteasome regulatory subunit N8 n=1 Tax=Tetraselmis sp. GSL018 TaxID=582737 RepID=A0A061S7F8_9CHLO|mmetsp:Transcript_8260/g.19810  ORF Transcript_8260/g.19810 Transcript_8260/m.19810 type:complete len:303 (-) Transcript_8260:319-1227(-)
MPAPEKVVVHPLVLLSVVDHYNRSAKDTKKRVVGVLLGETAKGQVDVTNCFAVPFEEDEKDPSIWFLDHSYLESMHQMFKKVNAKEKIIGWYSSGPRLRSSDLDINQLLSNYCETPILVICEVQPKSDVGLPTTAYYSKDEVREDGTQKSQKVFVNLPCEVGAHEAEEIGVEHLLRDVKDATVSTLATEVSSKMTALKGLKSRLHEILQYMEHVEAGRLPVNNDIIYELQDVFNLLPNLNAEELMKSFSVKSNDMMLVIYLSSLIRSVIALHNLIDNKEARARSQAPSSQKKPTSVVAPAKA